MGIELQFLPGISTGSAAALRVSGFLSLKDVTVMKSSLKRLLREGVRNWFVDLGDLRDMDEAVWEVLISMVRKLRRSNGRAVIRNCSDKVYVHLETRRWDREFLFPLRRAEHMAVLPAELQAYLLAQGSSGG